MGRGHPAPCGRCLRTRGTPAFAALTLEAGVLLSLHLLTAAAATCAFWTGALAPKGGRLHRRAGRWFARAVYATALTGATLAVVRLAGLGLPDDIPAAAAATERQTMWFVLYLLLIVVAPTQHGVAVVAAGPNPRAVRSRPHVILALASMASTVALIPAALLWARWHFLVVAPIGLIVGARNIGYANRTRAERADWEREHLTSTLTAGVTLHTALLVFGTSRSLGLMLTGVASWLPWIAPALVGLPAIAWQRRRRRGSR